MTEVEKWHKKELTEKQHDIYFRHLENMRDEGFSDIVDRWIKSARAMPGQFPTISDFWALYYIWKEEHPELSEKGIKVACDECHGRGWLWFRAPDPQSDIAYEYIVGCAVCKGFKIDVGPIKKVPTSTRAQLLAKGFAIWPYLNDLPQKNYSTIEEMTADISENKDDEIPF